MAVSSLVTPDSADTTTSTRPPVASARCLASLPIVSQRWRRDTEVPPNLRTIQPPGAASCAGKAADIDVSWGDHPTTGHEPSILSAFASAAGADASPRQGFHRLLSRRPGAGLRWMRGRLGDMARAP